MKFKVGDKVRATTDLYGTTTKSQGWEGIVTNVWESGYFDAETTKCLDGSIGHEFLHLNPKHFKLIQPETIVITNDGRVTMARLKQGNEVFKIGVAKCSPDDEFSLETGAKLALGRLFEQEPKKEEPKYKAGDRVRIVKEKTDEYWNPDGYMDKWLGKTMTIARLCGDGSERYYTMKEDASTWLWYPWMIEGLAKPSVIKRNGKECGVIGTPTELKDIHGKDLFVGDIVRVSTDHPVCLVYMVEYCPGKFQPSGCGCLWKQDRTDGAGLKVEKLIDWTACKAGDKLDNCLIEEE